MTAARLALAAALVLAVSAFASEPAAACAVCTGKDDAAVSWAMLKGTALLSLTPLAVIGAGVWYLRRRARQIDAAESARDAPAPEAPAAEASGGPPRLARSR
ncbi:MAG TPA: hypothetical protein VLC53_17175 [Myxococcota bacterium]|nr:hypothetical protein [Myxococcota bacterium]